MTMPWFGEPMAFIAIHQSSLEQERHWVRISLGIVRAAA